MNWSKITTIFKIAGYVILFILCAAGFVLATGSIVDGCNKRNIEEETITRIVYDTLTLKRYENASAKDTVIKWHEKIIVKEVPSDIEYRTRIDSVFIEKIKYNDFILGLEKKNTRLRVFAVSFQDSLLKERIYDNVGNNFSIYGKRAGVVVKTQRIYWEGLQLNAAYGFNGIEYDKGSLQLGIKTGINYLNAAGIEAGTFYDTKHGKFDTKITLKYNLLN